MRWVVAISVLAASVTVRAETYVPLGTLEVSCAQPGVTIEIDGQPWFACPGTQQKMLSSGPHSVVADREGHLPHRQNAFVPENGVERIDIRPLLPIDRPVVVEHRFPRWLPWTVGGAGLGIGIVGALVGVLAVDEMNSYDQAVASECGVGGCDFSDPQYQHLIDRRDKAETLDVTAKVMVVGGVAVLATGIVLLVMNKPVRQVPTVGVTATAGGGTAQLGWRF